MYRSGMQSAIFSTSWALWAITSHCLNLKSLPPRCQTLGRPPKKKNVYFRALPKLAPPPPLSSSLVLFFQTSKTTHDRKSTDDDDDCWTDSYDGDDDNVNETFEYTLTKFRAYCTVKKGPKNSGSPLSPPLLRPMPESKHSFFWEIVPYM